MAGIALVIHNVRSALNVGSLLRTAEGLGASKVYMTGYTPYPEAKQDPRMPHHRRRTGAQIHKTALGAEFYIKWSYVPEISICLNDLSEKGYTIIGLEQTPGSINLAKFKPAGNVALVVGNEVTGLEDSVLKRLDRTVQIPMSGRKESFNVAVAAAIALYHFRYTHIDKKVT